MQTSRSSLFSIETPFHVTSQEYEQMWPFMDHVWKSRNQESNSQQFHCAFRSSRITKSQCLAAIEVVHGSNMVTLRQVLGSQPHNHSLDTIDATKYCSAFRLFIQGELSKGYDRRNVQRVFHLTFDKQGLGSEMLPYSYIKNVYRHQQKKKLLRLAVPSPQSLMIDPLLQLITLAGFRSEKRVMSAGSVYTFASEQQLKTMSSYGQQLLILDTTMNTNTQGYVLVNLCLRNGSGTWLPSCHMLLTLEHGELFSAGFRIIKGWMGAAWKPKAFLIDGDNREFKAICEVFPETQVLRCTRHSRQTLLKRLDTKDMCQISITRALDSCQDDKERTYLQKKWSIEHSQNWGMWSRNHSQILREVTTSNAVEAFHSIVKHQISRADTSNVMLKKLSQIVGDLYRESSSHEAVIPPSSSVLTDKFSGLFKFPPFKVSLLSEQYEQAQRLIESNKDEVQWFYPSDEKTCRCRFYKAHGMPCQHMFARNTRENGDYLTEDYWKKCLVTYQTS